MQKTEFSSQANFHEWFPTLSPREKQAVKALLALVGITLGALGLISSQENRAPGMGEHVQLSLAPLAPGNEQRGIPLSAHEVFSSFPVAQEGLSLEESAAPFVPEAVPVPTVR